MIANELVDAVVAFVEQRGLSDVTVDQLRKSHEGVHFTYCMDDDICGPKAFKECETFNIYLVNSSDHCSVITPDSSLASGIVIAEVIDD